MRSRAARMPRTPTAGRRPAAPLRRRPASSDKSLPRRTTLTPVLRTPLLLVLVPCAVLAAGCGGSGGSSSSPPAALLHPAKLTLKAPQLYTVTFKTTKGTFTIGVHRTWAPYAADRFYNLVKARFYDGAEFFRVV